MGHDSVMDESAGAVEPARDRPGRPDRTLLVIAAVIAALVVVALIVVFTRGAPVTRDASTPEGVVQRYAAAVIAGDEDEALTYLVPEAADCRPYDPGIVGQMRVTLSSTVERENSADVGVLITQSYENGPFGGSGFEESGTFELERTPDGWRIENAPWPLTICDPGTWQ